KLIAISSLATVSFRKGDAEIQRENLQSMGVVSARLENRDLGSTIKDIQREIASKISLQQGYHIEYGGEYAEQQKSFHELLLILVTSVLLVFGVMLFLFNDFLLALSIIVTAVAGIGGSYLALFLTGTPL